MSNSDTKNLLFSIFKNLLIKGVALPLSFLSGVLLARLLGAENYGQYALLFSVATVIASGVVRACSVLLVREISGAIALNRYSEVWGSLLIGLLLVILLLILVCLFNFIPFMSGINVSSTTVSIVALLLVISIIGPLLRGLHHTALGLFVEQAARPLFQCGFLLLIGVVYLSGDLKEAKFGIDSLLFGLAMAGVLGMLFVFYGLRKVPYAKPRFKSEWFCYSVPVLIFIGYAQGLSSQLPILLLGKFGEPAAVANLRVADSIAGLISITLLAANMALGPKLAELKAKGDLKQFEHLLRITSSLVALVAIPLGLAFVLSGSFLIPALYGEEYSSAVYILWISCLTQVVNSFCGPVMLAMNMLNREIINLQAILFALTIAIISGLILIPDLGAVGAAFTAMIGTITWNIYLVVALYKAEGILSLPYIKKRAY